mmetsp:Transcript_26940/g.32615  ORF Transcript_26940/g.32615 Transcript_26940/m.32615 type:complete len:165 (-) Transcript_26940:744-1238(-)
MSLAKIFNFGAHKIPVAHTFHVTDHCYSFVNLKPIVDGHVLVSSKRSVARLCELTEEEHSDLWRAVRAVSKVVEQVYRANALNISVQDGKEAGQSVAHVHVHILPRHTGDFTENDEVYEKLEDFEFTIPEIDSIKVFERSPNTGTCTYPFFNYLQYINIAVSCS